MIQSAKPVKYRTFHTGTQIGSKSTVLSGQAAQLSNVSAKGNVTVNTSDPEVIQAAITAMASNSNKVASSISDVATASQQNLASAYNNALGQVATLATAQSTGGASLAADTIKKMVLGGLAIVAAVVIAFFFRKKTP